MHRNLSSQTRLLQDDPGQRLLYKGEAWLRWRDWRKVWFALGRIVAV